MKYKILFGSHVSELEKLVGQHIEAGWKPQGGVCADKTYLYQAMVKE